MKNSEESVYSTMRGKSRIAGTPPVFRTGSNPVFINNLDESIIFHLDTTPVLCHYCADPQ